MPTPKPSKKALLLLAVTLILGAVFLFFIQNNSSHDTITDTPETTTITVYLQDKDAVLYSDCGITYPHDITVSKTTAVADASLTYLFEHELAQYGTYQSVVVVDGVAQITIANEHDPDGLRIASLSSCESRHLFAVLQDTLTQYESIQSVELYSPSGKIEF